MPMQSLELTLAPASDQRVRQLWQVLSEAGLPSQAQHTGATNAPHLTVLSAPEIGAKVQATAARELGALLPVRLQVPGLVVFGSRRRTLGLLIAAPPALTAAVRTIQAAAGAPTAAWVPHITVARRLEPAQLGRAVEALDTVAPIDSLDAVALRHWDPATRAVDPLG